MPGPNPVGIDLGTSRSAMAGIDPSGRSVMLRSREGDIFIDSVVLLDDNEVIVGGEAKKSLETDPDRVADFAKRDLGQPFYWRLIRGRQLPPEVLVACIVRRLKHDLTAAGLADAQAVIAVPGQFDETRRQAALDAATMAGLPPLTLINATTAAAIALAEQTGYLGAAAGARPASKTLIFDLGSGGFDVALCELAPDSVTILASEGEVRLGGREWDMRLRDHLAGEFCKRHGADPRRDIAALARLNRTAEEVKQSLSTRDSVEAHIDFAGRALDMTISRALFEDLTADLLERAAYSVRRTLAAADVEWSAVNEILLVGGATRMPMVARMLREASGIAPRLAVNPDEVVARGAALHAAAILRSREPQAGAIAGAQPGALAGAQGGPQAGSRAALRVVDVAAHSTSIEKAALNSSRAQIKTLISRGAPLPARASETLSANKPNPHSMVVRLRQGESPSAEQCILVAEAVLHGFPRSVARDAPIAVSLQIDPSGRLAISAALVHGVALRVMLRRPANLSEASLARWREAITRGAGFDAYRRVAETELATPARQTAGGEELPELPAESPSAAPATISAGSYRDAGASDDAYAVAEEPAEEIAAESQGEFPGLAGEGFAGSAEPTGVETETSDGAETPWLEPARKPAAQGTGRPSAKASTRDSTSAAESPADEEPFQPAHPSRRRPKRESGPLAKLFNLILFLSSQIIGLGLGYYLLCRFKPELNYLHLKLPGIPEVAPADAPPAEAPPK